MDELTNLIKRVKPEIIFFEKLNGSAMSARANKLLSYTRCILFIMEYYFTDIKWIPVTTKDSKLIVGKNASKDSIMDYVKVNYTYFQESKLPKCKFEHIADSIVIKEAGDKLCNYW